MGRTWLFGGCCCCIRPLVLCVMILARSLNALSSMSSLAVGAGSSSRISTTNEANKDNNIHEHKVVMPVGGVSDFIMERTVVIRSCPQGGLLPLFEYKAVHPARRRRQSDTSLHSPILPRLNDFLQDPAVAAAALQSTSLSVSAAAMACNWHDLTLEERCILHNKICAEARASQPLDAAKDLHILYWDHDICVTSKPSGLLSVPGPRRNPSLANLVYSVLQPHTQGLLEHMDQMVVHRLDMDTSGILVFALNTDSLSKLHDDFRGGRIKGKEIKKRYQALLVGHLAVPEMDLELDLERDPQHVPFMRIAQPKQHKRRHLDDSLSNGANVNQNDCQKENEDEDASSSDRKTTFYDKFMNQAPKPSRTELRVLAWETWPGTDLPVTRVELVPHTGRTHQLRVHCAAVGHPIVGDDIYGFASGAGDCGGPFVPRNGSSSNNDNMELHRRLDQLQIPLCLHAQQLCLRHPRTGAPFMFSCPPPF